MLVTLTPWQQKQAGMLGVFSSGSYLMELHRLISQLINGDINPLLDLADEQKRDHLLTDSRWGERNTATNWSNHAWPFLKDLQAAIARKIAARQSGDYQRTTVHDYFRGIEQFSTNWMTPEEEERLQKAMEHISAWAQPLDLTVADERHPTWDDFGFAYYYPTFAKRFPRIPRYRVRTDLVCESGTIPAHTGIYVSKDDRHAALQFAWSGGAGQKLRAATTFNDLGLAALAAVGRDELWFNAQKMFDFAVTSPFAPTLRESVIWNDGPHPDLAPSAVARCAFVTKKSDWYLVEPIEGVFDDLANLGTSSLDANDSTKAGPRLLGGDSCTVSGYYMTPSHPGVRRYISRGENAPDHKSEFGQVIWQWDNNQTPE